MPQNMRTCGTLLALAGVVLLLGAAALDGAAAGQRDAQPADGGAEKVRALAGELQQVTVSGRRDTVVSDLLAVSEARYDTGVPGETPRDAAVGSDDNMGGTPVFGGGQGMEGAPVYGGAPKADDSSIPPPLTNTPEEKEEKAAPADKEAAPAEGAPPVEEAQDAETPEPPGPRIVPAPITREANASLAAQVRALVLGTAAGASPGEAGGVVESSAPEVPVAEDLSKMAAPAVTSATPPAAAPAAPAAPAGAPAAPAPVKPKYEGDPLAQMVNVDFRDMDLTNVVAMLAHKADINVIAGTALEGTVTANLRNVTLRQAIDTSLRMNNLGMIEELGIYKIVPVEEADMVNRVTEIINFKNAKADEVAKLITDVTRTMGGRATFAVTADKTANLIVLSAPKHRIEEVAALARSLDQEKPKLAVVTEAIPLSYADTKEVATTLQTMLSPEIGKVSMDERARQVVITDIPAVVEQAKELVKSLDLPVKQVAIETMVVDIQLSDAADTGVKWLFDTIQRQSRANAAIGPDAPKVGTLQDFSLESNINNLQSAAGLLNFGLLTDNIDWKGAVQLEVRNNNGRLVSNPVVMTVENQPAQIAIAQEIPYVELTQTQQGGNQTSTRFKEIGTVLEVTPKVTHDNNIICSVAAKESAINGTFNGVPIEDKREMSSTMRLADGQTIYIGGLRKNSNTSTARKIPILGDIPIMGIAFRSNTRDEKINEMLVFLTCSILKDGTTLTDRQREVMQNAHPEGEDLKVDALQTIGHDTRYPQTTKYPQMKWRRGQ